MLVRAPRILLFVPALALLSPVRRDAADAGMKPLPAPTALPRGRLDGPARGRAEAREEGAKTAKAPKAPKNPPVVLYTVNHKETFSLRLRDAQGKPVKGNQKRFDRFLRCHHTEAKHAMNPRLMRLLYQTGRHWPGKRLEVVSGFRSPKVAKNPRSPHMKGLACDFRVEGVRRPSCATTCARPSTRWASATTRTRPSCTSTSARTGRRSGSTTRGPGERAVYSENPSDDLQHRPRRKLPPDARSMNPGRPMKRQCRGTAPAKAAPPKDEAQSRGNDETGSTVAAL